MRSAWARFSWLTEGGFRQKRSSEEISFSLKLPQSVGWLIPKVATWEWFPSSSQEGVTMTTYITHWAFEPWKAYKTMKPWIQSVLKSYIIRLSCSSHQETLRTLAVTMQQSIPTVSLFMKLMQVYGEFSCFTSWCHKIPEAWSWAKPPYPKVHLFFGIDLDPSPPPWSRRH